MKYQIIKVSQDKVTFVDADVYEWASKFNWSISNSSGYFYVRRTKQSNKKRKFILLHREILNVSKDQMVDHINGNTLDNRRENLRVCSNRQNQRNQKLSRKNTSGFKGVSWYKRLNKWIARIKVDNKDIYLGLFQDKKEAALAYDKAAKKYFKEFANLNFKD